MKSIPWVKWFCVVGLGASIAVLGAGCKKDESNPIAPAPVVLPAFDFGTPNQTFSVSGTSGPSRARLTGGTLPYTVIAEPNAAVGAAYVSHDTLTVIPIAPGSTSVGIADSLGDRIVIIAISVTGSGGSLGSGTVTAYSNTQGSSLSFTGTGLWPPTGGPAVIAVYDTLARELVILGYQQVSGPRFNFALVAINMPEGVGTGTFSVVQNTGFQVGYNVDTSQSNVTYQSTSGSIIVSSVNGSLIQGNYSGEAVLGSGQPTPFAGIFNVVYVRGISPLQIGRSSPSKLTGARVLR